MGDKDIKEVNPIFRTRSLLFAGNILPRRRNRVKANPADIAYKTRIQRSLNGDKLFSKEEWFSRLLALNKSGV